MNGKRLYRCRQDRQIAGVAGGMAEYFGVDPTVIRILWILSVFLGGFTILLYLAMAIIVPLEPVGWTGPNPAWAGQPGFGGPNPAGPNPAGPNPASAGEGAAAGAAFAAAEGSAPAAGGTSHWTAPAGDPAGQPHWAQGQGQGQGWAQGQGWVPGPAHTGEPRNGSFMLVFGVLLVVFGTLALLGPVFPGWLAGIHLGPAFIVALGVALLAVAFRRPAADRRD